jgi:predicted outer membrane protein
MAAIRVLVAALAIAVVPACDDDFDDDVIIVDDPVGETADEGFAEGDQLAAIAADELTGDNYTIVIGKTASILAVLNDGEIDQAAFAVQVIGAPDIFDFANALIVDHENANVELDAAVRYYGVGYIASDAAGALSASFSNGLSELRSTPPSDIDFTFVQLQVINHAAALVVLDELAFQVGPGVMGDYIVNTRGLIELHLDESMSLLETFY